MRLGTAPKRLTWGRKKKTASLKPEYKPDNPHKLRFKQSDAVPLGGGFVNKKTGLLFESGAYAHNKQGLVFSHEEYSGARPGTVFRCAKTKTPNQQYGKCEEWETFYRLSVPQEKEILTIRLREDDWDKIYNYKPMDTVVCTRQRHHERERMEEPIYHSCQKEKNK